MFVCCFCFESHPPRLRWVEQLYFIKTGKVKMSMLEDNIHHVMIGLFSAGTSMCLYEVLHKKLSMCSMLAVSTVEMWSLEAADFLSLLRGRNAAVKHFERTAIAQHSAFCCSIESPTIVMESDEREAGLKIKSTIVVDGDIVRHDAALSHDAFIPAAFAGGCSGERPDVQPCAKGAAYVFASDHSQRGSCGGKTLSAGSSSCWTQWCHV